MIRWTLTFGRFDRLNPTSRAVRIALGSTWRRGSIEVETWGEDSESLVLYRELGFEEVEREVGWNLILGTGHA